MCVRACVRACVCGCVRAYVCKCVYACVCAGERPSVRACSIVRGITLASAYPGFVHKLID